MAADERLKALIAGFSTLLNGNSDKDDLLKDGLSKVLSLVEKSKASFDNLMKINNYLEEKGIKYRFDNTRCLAEPDIAPTVLVDELISETEEKIKLQQSIILGLIDYKKKSQNQLKIDFVITTIQKVSII